MDNKVFNVNGKTDSMLLKALELVFEQHGPNTRCNGWAETKEDGLILLRYMDRNTTYEARHFPGDGITAADMVSLVKTWLSGEFAKTVVMEGWDRDIDHDGHNSMGWRVYSEDWGHVGPAGSGAICAVKPAWMWHGK